MGFLGVMSKKTNKESKDEKPRAVAVSSARKSFSATDGEPAAKSVSAYPGVKIDPAPGLQAVAAAPAMTAAPPQAEKPVEAAAPAASASDKPKDGKESKGGDDLNNLLSLFEEEKVGNYELDLMTKDMKDVPIGDLLAQCQELMPLLRSRRAARVG